MTSRHKPYEIDATFLNKFGALFDRYKEKKTREKQEEEEAKVEEKAFVENFYECRKNIILPAMDEISKYVESKKHTCVINHPDDVQNGDKFTSISIRFEIKEDPNQTAKESKVLVFTVRGDKSLRKVLFKESTKSPGEKGPSVQKYDVEEEISGDMICKKIYDFVERNI